ncbi:MAG: hypothetical protein JSV04_01810 [Candidatus Heimdallarchaeota archaeon]|nr:MAG: hypothetical protein JSV04_01810 [Candidatus Heimdallarchaeota archaeon]
MKTDRRCCKCDEPFYASYKGKYYCPAHLEEQLAYEKQMNTNNSNIED